MNLVQRATSHLETLMHDPFYDLDISERHKEFKINVKFIQIFQMCFLVKALFLNKTMILNSL